MNVKELRTKKNLSQEQLGELTGIPRDRIAKWEQGKGIPKAEDYRKLQEVFREELPTEKSPDQYDQDFRDKYIHLLEATLQEKTSLLIEVKENLKRLPDDMIALTTKAIASQHELAKDLRAGQMAVLKELKDIKSSVGSSGKKTLPGQKH